MVHTKRGRVESLHLREAPRGHQQRFQVHAEGTPDQPMQLDIFRLQNFLALVCTSAFEERGLGSTWHFRRIYVCPLNFDRVNKNRDWCLPLNWKNLKMKSWVELTFTAGKKEGMWQPLEIIHVLAWKAGSLSHPDGTALQKVSGMRRSSQNGSLWTRPVRKSLWCSWEKHCQCHKTVTWNSLRGQGFGIFLEEFNF